MNNITHSFQKHIFINQLQAVVLRGHKIQHLAVKKPWVPLSFLTIHTGTMTQQCVKNYAFRRRKMVVVS